MEEEKKEIGVTNDLMFQRIFGKVGNEEITKGFLEKVLGINIESVDLDVNKRMQGDRINHKIGRLDVKAKLNDGTVVLIEMQVSGYRYMSERLLYYWSKIYAEGLQRSDYYESLNKTIAILISADNLKQTEGIDRYHTIWDIREQEEKDRKFTEDLEIHVIELKKFKEGQEERPEDNWIKFIKARGKEEMEKISKADKAVAEAMEEWERLVDDPENHEEYLWREKELRDKISFIKASKEDGIEEGEKIRFGKRRKTWYS